MFNFSNRHCSFPGQVNIAGLVVALASIVEAGKGRVHGGGGGGGGDSNLHPSIQ